jgi:predicted MPP superfamily phosphohydrolase
MMVYNRLWLYNDSNIDVKKKTLFLINVQKTIIHTVIDLINSLVEANLEPNKNFLYEIINTRINVKLNNTFNDPQLLKRIDALSMKNIKFDESTKKITFLTKKINLIDLDIELNSSENLQTICDLHVKKLDKNPILPDKNSIDILTNCPNGKFHNWLFKNNDLICSICNKSYNDLIKVINKNTSTEQNQTEYLDKLKFINLKKLSMKYCISGDNHDIDKVGLCLKCNKNINTFEPSEKELKQLEKNIDIKTNEQVLLQINNMKKYNETLKNTQDTTKKILNKLLSRYEKLTNNKLENYVIDFVNRLSKILGNKIKVNDKVIYLKETSYIIDHDYFGNSLKENLHILSSEDKIQIAYKHQSFGIDVIYYKDKANKVYVYYDSITLQYIGYSEDNKNIKKSRNNASLQIELSIKDCIFFLNDLLVKFS